MLRVIILSLFCIATLISSATTIIESIPTDYANDALTNLHTAKGKFSLYLDKSEGIILDWPNELSQPTDSFFIKFDSKLYEFITDKGLTFKNLNAGDYKISWGKATDGNDIVKAKSFGLKVFNKTPFFKHEAILLALLLGLLALVFYTNSLPSCAKFYKFVPALLLCYFLPAILNSAGIINGQDSQLYYVSSRFLLPASLVLLCLSIDLKGILNLGPKALIMFFAATLGVVVGGPLALWIVGSFAPDALGGDSANALWRGLSTVAGSWIGGGANQTALKEIADCPEGLFSNMILVDVALANVWMAFLLFGAGMDKKINKFLKADNSAVDALQTRVENYQASISRTPSLKDLMIIFGVAFLAVGVAHWGANFLSPWIGGGISDMKASGFGIAQYISSFGSGFFWLIVISTAIENSQILTMLLVGAIWMLVHITILLLTAKIIRAPFFFVAVGSQANIGGAASAPVVASAFSPALAPVGVLLAVMGYAVGTLAAVVCMELMHAVS